MSSYVVGSLIGGGFVLLGGALTLVRESVVRNAERRAAHAAKLEAAMREYLAVLDLIAIETESAPGPVKQTRVDRWLERKAAGTAVDFYGTLMARILHRVAYGQRLNQIGDRLTLAATQLRLIAPDPVLAIIREIEEATERAGPSGRHWNREWSAIREDVRVRLRQELAAAADK